MLNSGNTWSFVGEPQGDGHWWFTSTYRLKNCECEPLTLEQACDSCPVLSAFGEIAANRSVSSAIHGLRTIVWNVASSTKKPCEWDRLERRPGSLFNDSGVLRLRDDGQQVEFVLGSWKPNCDQKLPSMFTVVGEQRLAIFILDNTSAPMFREGYRYDGPEKRGREKRLSQTVMEALGSMIYPEVDQRPVITQNLGASISEHLQYVESSFVDQENVIVSQINRIDCKLDKLRVFELLTLSRSSGILAARSFGLTDCQSLEGFGKQAVIRQCEKKIVDFSVEITACGAEPRAGNFTIDRDGFMLRPFRPCLWRSSLVNFNGDAYIARDGDWVMEKVTRVISHGVLLSQFKHDVDMSAHLLSSALE